MFRLFVAFLSLGLLTGAAASPVASYYASHWSSRMMTIAVNAWTVGPGAILLLGDSNTEMMRPIEIGGCQVINAGFGGARIADIATRADGLARLAKPTIVHIMVGTNDARADLKDMQSADVEAVAEAEQEWAEMRPNLEKIVAAFQSQGATVVLWGLPPIGPGAGDLADFSHVDDVIADVARAKGVALETAWAGSMTGADGYAKPGWLIGDGIHLSPNGQKVRIARIAAVDGGLLEERRGGCVK